MDWIGWSMRFPVDMESQCEREMMVWRKARTYQENFASSFFLFVDALADVAPRKSSSNSYDLLVQYS